VRPAVLLDRDGTMIHDVGYLSRREDLVWFPWTIDAIRLLSRAGFAVVVVTNQGGIGLGRYPEAFVQETHAAMSAALEAAGARVDAWFYCPHHPRATIVALRHDCECRKPAPGMARRAAGELDLDLGRSFVVGDKLSDVGLAGGIGARGVLVRTGHGEDQLAWAGRGGLQAAHVASDLMAATSWILESARSADEEVRS
jgi:D-glycero-D-manno-heptose 1,7-bisphosphate phosphatase